MIVRAEPLPIGSRVLKTAAWQGLTIPRYGTTTSVVYERRPAHYYVDVRFDGRSSSESVHLSRLRRVSAEEGRACQ